jgi:hypothetical protein
LLSSIFKIWLHFRDTYFTKFVTLTCINGGFCILWGVLQKGKICAIIFLSCLCNWIQKNYHQYRTSRVGSAENNSKNRCQNFRAIIFSKNKFFVWWKQESPGIILFLASAETNFLKINKYSAWKCQPCPTGTELLLSHNTWHFKNTKIYVRNLQKYPTRTWSGFESTYQLAILHPK